MIEQQEYRRQELQGTSELQVAPSKQTSATLTMIKLAFTIILLSLSSLTHAFSIHQTSHIVRSPLKNNVKIQEYKYNHYQYQHHHHSTTAHAKHTSALYNSKRPLVFEESEKRGAVLFAFVMILNVWLFSIPVELRRGHFCFTEKCATNRSRCSDCVTFPEWFGQIGDYYANGGGVNFDFSVEEK